MRWPSLIPPVGSPILPRLTRGAATFDWTFGGDYTPIFVDSGTTALRLAIATAGLVTGNQGPVWLPSYGCPDLLSACWAAGHKAALYEVGPQLPFYSGTELSTARFDIAVACHFLGLRAPLEPLRRALAPRSVLIIEDSAQYFPSSPIPRFEGDLVVLSFGKGKPVSLLEGGCLLARQGLAAEAARIAARWDRANPGLRGQIKRRIHDFVIRPEVYGLVSRIPGLRPGEVHYRAAPNPRVLNSNFATLAATAAAGYQAEKTWMFQQRRLQQQLSCLLPTVTDLWPVGDPEGATRLLRYPLLAATAQAAGDLIAYMGRRGACATRMYREPLPAIRGLPVELAAAGPGAQYFGAHCITLPVETDLTNS